MTELRAELAAAERVLAAAGVPNPRWDAEQLARHALGLSHLHLATGLGPAAAEFRRLVTRRAGREPLQHLLGRSAFRRLELAVGPGVFLPRPETELLVDLILVWSRQQRLDSPLCVDLCAGAGPLGLSLAHELPGARVHLVERAAQASDWLQRNAADRAAGGDPPVQCHAAAMETVPDGILAGMAGDIDIVVSNPPYLRLGLRASLEPEVSEWDPAEALFAGEDGLGALVAVRDAAARLLRPGGLLAVEHGEHQGPDVRAMLSADGGWSQVRIHQDLVRRDRFATAVRS